MEIEKVADDKERIKLTPDDVESAIRQFICACHPEYQRGWIIDSQDAQAATADARKVDY